MKARPQPGKSVNRAFYVHVLDRYDVLAARGRRDPCIVIAEELGANHQTVKGWVRRGRRYLQRQTVPLVHMPHCETCRCYS